MLARTETVTERLHAYVQREGGLRSTSASTLVEAVTKARDGEARDYLLQLGAAAHLGQLRHAVKTVLKRSDEPTLAPASSSTRRGEIVVRKLSSLHFRQAQELDNLLVSWVLSNGTQLGDATGKMLREEAVAMRRSGDGMYRNAEFYEALAARTKTNEKLKNAVELKDVVRIKESFYGK